MSMMQSQHFSMGRSVGFNLGATYSSHRPQQQQQHAPSVSSSGVSFTPGNNQDLLHVHGFDMFPSSHSSYHSQMSQLRVIQNSMCHNVVLPNNHQHYTKLGKRSSRNSLVRLNNGDDFFVEALCQDGRIYSTIAPELKDQRCSSERRIGLFFLRPPPSHIDEDQFWQEVMNSAEEKREAAKILRIIILR